MVQDTAALETLSNKPDLVIITGAGRGIGRSIAKDMGRYTSVLCISQSERALETAAQIRLDGGTAEGLVLDLADLDKVHKSVGGWLLGKAFRRIGAVLAAGMLGPPGPFMKTDPEEWERTFRVNIQGNLSVVRALLPVQKTNQFGRLLFFGGGGAAYAYPAFPAYAASKASLVRIVENLHEDLKHEGNFATVILAPGAVETDMLTAVRASGGEVRTTVSIEEPTTFAREFLSSESCAFSGRFVHVRDEWRRYLNPNAEMTDRDVWKLRRIE